MRTLTLATVLAMGTQDTRRPSGADFPATVQHALGRPLPAEWQPYFVDMTNRLNRDVLAVVRLEDENGRTVATRREPMPSGTRKRVFLYLPTGSRWGAGVAQQLRYTVRDAAGKALSPGGAPIQGQAAYAPGAFHVGLLTSDRDSDAGFSLPRTLGSGPLDVVRLQTELFPDRWIGLAGLHALIVHDARLDELTTDQARALADYVRQGGTVILSPGITKGWLAQPAIAAFAKIRVAETETRTELQALNRSYGPFRQKEPFLFHRIQGGAPWRVLDSGPVKYALEVHKVDSGFGRVMILPFDVRRPPFDTWKGLEGLWTELLSSSPRRFQDSAALLVPASSFETRMQLFRNMATFVNPYPSFLLLLALAALFLIIVGPANYLVLRRLRMTLLIVVTVPVISLAFLVGVLGIGYLLKGTSTVVHSLRLLRTRQGLDCARETQLVNVFSPSTRAYDVSFAPGTYGMPLDRVTPDLEDTRNPFYYSNQEGPARLEFEDGAAPAFRGVAVGQWQSWPVEVRGLRDLGGGITFQTSGGVLHVTNASPRRIARVAYLEVGYGGFALPMGEVAPGATVEAPLDKSRYDPVGALGFTRDSFGGRLLGNYFAQLQTLHRQDRALRGRQHKVLVCVLRDEDPSIRLDARTSGDSRSLTLLFVTDEES